MKSKFQEIRELKKGQTGYGLLIEHDGHILPRQEMIQQIKEDINNGDKFVIPDNFIVSAVFQKYGVKNANGRIYPEKTLKREVQKYLENQVANHCAIGSLDHPACQLADTRILTENGWKFITEVQKDENILTLNENGKIEIHPVNTKIEQEYEGKLIHIKGRFIDIKVTPNHKFPIFDRNKNFKGFYTAQDILNKTIPDQNHCSFKKVGEWHNESEKYFVIEHLNEKDLLTINEKELKEKYTEDLKIPMEVWMKFFGIYLAEGYNVYKLKDRIQGSRVVICQKKQEVCDEIEEMLNDFPLSYTITYSQNGEKNYNIYDLRLAKYLYQFGDCYRKFVPYEVKKQGKDMLQIFYDWFVLGDGRKRGVDKENYYSDDVFSASEKLIMDLNEIQLKIGYCGSYHVEDRKYDRIIENRLIEGKNCSNLHFSMRCYNKHITLDDRRLSVTEEDYKGMVYCVEVENHNFYTMCNNGCCLWSGNSSVLSGHDVSHNILDLRWEGKTLVGEMKLHLSPGYKKYGICSTSGDLAANMLLDGIQIGVSSRALGSLEEKFGTSIVSDDLSIIGWDIVIENSTPGAKIGRNMEELQQYVEGKEKEGELLSDKLNKVKKILD